MHAGAGQAVVDGVVRVIAAPAVLTGFVALMVLYGPVQDARGAAGALLLWAFLSGGALDRYARQRPTRARGFFGACGAHFGAMFRAVLIALLPFAAYHLAMGRGFPNDLVHRAAFVLSLLVALTLSIAQVRIAVEDRRSAIGAFLAAGRFALRHAPGVVLLFAVFGLGGLGVQLASERLLMQRAWQQDAVGITATVLECFALLAWLAALVSLFQSRLAHAGYTAAPELEWPDSPAAEAIANAAPRPAAGPRPATEPE